MYKSKPILFIFVFSSVYFLFACAYSFLLYDEDLLSRIIHESTLYGDGALYFPFVKYLSLLDFNKSFDPNIDNLRNLSVPYGSLFVHSIFYKVFGNYGLILVNYISIFLFILIFYKIFNIYFSVSAALIASLGLFTIPIMLHLLSLDGLRYFQVISSDIFTLRAHRPIFISLIFYIFIYIVFIIHSHNENNFNKKYFLILGLLAGLSFAGFYYYAVIEFLFLFLYFLYKYKKDIFAKLFQNRIALSYFFISFLFIVLPFLINLFFFTENDFLIRNSSFELTPKKKFILLKHYISKYLELKFLLLIILTAGLLYFIKRKNKKNYQLLIIFFLLFISSLIAPVLFIITSNKSALLYHFNNMTLVTLFLFIYCFIFLLNDHFPKILHKEFLQSFLITILIITNLFGVYSKQRKAYHNTDNKDYRNEFNQVINKINSIKINLNNASILTFDNHLLVWLILNDVRYLNINNQLFSSKNDLMIEDDLIQNFKFLNLNDSHFIKFLQNEKSSWRLINYNVTKFFYYKYSANSLNTFNDSLDFDEELLMIIKNTPPTLMQQFAIPNKEFDRLLKKFIKSNLSKDYMSPNLIILKKNNFIYQNINKNIHNFCMLFDGKFYAVYASKLDDNFCKTVKKL